ERLRTSTAARLRHVPMADDPALVARAICEVTARQPPSASAARG
ncbi:MAG: hypothetical protein QOJ21_2634, partial [Solirubrobacteraceae bacterium]|nr:hypothetical protein [Solirubrobacteraceae bacterium]